MRRERGFALLMVLWTLVLLAFLAAVVGSDARTEIYLARNLVESARAEALADAGVYRAASGLAKPPREGGFRGDGQVYVWRQQDEEVRFTVRDEGGKIDLNQASDALLRELFIGAGVDPVAAAELADAVVDFRDEDDEKGARGAEFREYAAAGVGWKPKNAPFTFVDELIYILGMTPEIYRKVTPFVTVYGEQELPHEDTAAPQVVAAMTAAEKAPRSRSKPAAGAGSGAGRSSAGSSTIDGSPLDDESGGFGNRRSGSQSTSPRRSGFGASSDGTIRGSGPGSGLQAAGNADRTDEEQDRRDRSGATAFAIHAEGRTLDGTVFARDAVVDVAGTENAGVAIRSWRQGVRTLFPPEPASGG